MLQLLNRIKITTLLHVGFVGILLVTALMTAEGVLKLRKMVRLGEQVATQQQRHLAAAQWRSATELNLNRVMAIARSGAHEQLSLHLTGQMAKTTGHIDSLKKGLEDSLSDAAQRAQLGRIATMRQAYLDMRASVMSTLKANPAAGLQRVDQHLAPAAAGYLATVDELLDLIDRDTQALADQQRDEALAAEQAERFKLVLTGVTLVVGALIIWRITQSVRAPMVQAGQLAETIASGDLSRDIRVERSDEIGQLMRQLGHMQDALRRMVRHVRQGTDTIQVATQEIASGNQNLSARTEATAADLQQTASSVEKLTGTVAHTADLTRQADDMVRATRGHAQHGSGVVGQVVRVMQQIDASAKKISDIIGVIDGIAFQTNILALNAAVEAARAGEQGRGFAVVAGEVRALAQRSAVAAKEIKTLIGESVSRAEAGSRLVGHAGQAMVEIEQGVRRVADIVEEIKAATADQHDGIGQVHTAVQRLDAMTQQNAALVQQSATAAGSLRTQAQQLTELVSAFRLAPT